MKKRGTEIVLVSLLAILVLNVAYFVADTFRLCPYDVAVFLDTWEYFIASIIGIVISVILILLPKNFHFISQTEGIFISFLKSLVVGLVTILVFNIAYTIGAAEISLIFFRNLIIPFWPFAFISAFGFIVTMIVYTI